MASFEVLMVVCQLRAVTMEGTNLDSEAIELRYLAPTTNLSCCHPPSLTDNNISPIRKARSFTLARSQWIPPISILSEMHRTHTSSGYMALP